MHYDTDTVGVSLTSYKKFLAMRAEQSFRQEGSEVNEDLSQQRRCTTEGVFQTRGEVNVTRVCGEVKCGQLWLYYFSV